MNERIMIIVTLLLVVMVQLRAQPEPPEGKQWQVHQSLTDEFEAWDASKWYNSYWNYGVPVMMTGQNSGVTDGKLWIKATLDQGKERWFQTARIMSHAKISYPMYTECAIRSAHISAYTTFWLNNGDINDRDEIDIYENNSKPSVNLNNRSRPWVLYSQYFLAVDGNTEREDDNFNNNDLSVDNPLRGVPWNEAFHTVGLWWKDEHNLQFYLDGEEAGRLTTRRAFTRDLQMIWDLWSTAETYSGGIAIQEDLLDDSINTMYVDWVHTYTLEDATDIHNVKRPKEASVQLSTRANVLRVKLGMQSSNAELLLYSMQGRCVGVYSLQSATVDIDVSDCNPGMYIAKVTQQGKAKSQTIIL